MRQIKVENLSIEVFSEYGSYSDMINPTGCYLGDIPARFYRDRVIANYDPTSLVAFGVNEIYPREKNLIEKTEHHFNTCEVLMPIDGDIFLAVGPARKEPRYEEFRAFRIPKGTLVCMLAAGGDGTISGNSNVIPEYYSALYHAFLGGDYGRAAKLQDKILQLNSALSAANGLACYKACLVYRGVIQCAKLRSPLSALPQDETEKLLGKIESLHFTDPAL